MNRVQEAILKIIDKEKTALKFYTESLVDESKTRYENIKMLCEIENNILGINEEILTYNSCICKEGHFMGESDIRDYLDMFGFTYGYHDDLEDDLYLFIYIFCTESNYDQLVKLAKKSDSVLRVF